MDGDGERQEMNEENIEDNGDLAPDAGPVDDPDVDPAIEIAEEIAIDFSDDTDSDGDGDDDNDEEADGWRMYMRQRNPEPEDVDDYSSIDEEEEEGDEDDRETFDTQLPTRHSYLGDSLEVSGRHILEEDLVQEIVLMANPGVILMPGQTLPLTIFRPNVISLMKKLIDTTKTFGSIHLRYHNDEHGNPGIVTMAPVGTTAEIYEFRDPPESSNEVGFKMKVKGRQRFRVLSSRTQIDGTRLAKVELLREKVLGDPLFDVRLRSLDRLRGPCDTSSPEDDRQDDAEPQRNRGKMPFGRGGFSGLMSRLRHGDKAKERENKEEYLPKVPPYKLSRLNHLRTKVYAAPITRWPNWVYEQYDARCLVEQVHKVLGTLRLFSQTQVTIPTDPVELSFWVAMNLPIDDAQRLKVLQMDCAVPRLRMELSLLKKCQILCCFNCGEEVAHQDDIFSMSQEGPQSAYVNPSGHVHETLTLYTVKGIRTVGASSTEYSWFPGYAWTISVCAHCDHHMGWRFTAVNRKLRPRKFWGISRKSIKPLIDIETENMGNDEDGSPAVM